MYRVWGLYRIGGGDINDQNTWSPTWVIEFETNLAHEALRYIELCLDGIRMWTFALQLPGAMSPAEAMA